MASADRRVEARAVITHRSGRALALQCGGGDGWTLPGGAVADGHFVDRQLRGYIRAATGLEVGPLHLASIVRTDDGATAYIACSVTGVGADITAATRTMCWLDRAAIATHMAPRDAAGMLAALDACSAPTPLDVAPLAS